MRDERRPVTMQAFIDGDVYIDYPYERVKFRWEHATKTVYQWWYFEATETQIRHDAELYNEAHSGGFAITREEYYRDEPPDPSS